LTSLHPNIKFTIEQEKGSLPILVTITKRREDDTLKFKVYWKKTNQDLQFESHQPMKHKMGVIRTLNPQGWTNSLRHRRLAGRNGASPQSPSHLRIY
jgi:hypothetical protein